MQPNVIVLPVDVDNDGGTTPAVDLTFTRFDEFQNRSEYISEAHTIAARDKVGFYRTLPKASGNFRGVAKVAIKFTKDFEVNGVDASTVNVAPGIFEVSGSLPVGLTPAQTLELRMRAVALLLDDDVCGPLFDQLMI